MERQCIIASVKWSTVMTINPDELIETRVPTPADLAGMIKFLRDENKWSQATLAEIAKLTDRTIQRVESGEPSSVDTRRALAGAFKLDDLDTFNKPMPFPNVEKWKARSADIEKTTVVVPLTKIADGRTIRTMIEGTHSAAIEEIGDTTEEAREAFAGIADYLTDYNDVRECYSMSQRLGVDRDMDALLKTIDEEGAAVGAGLRHASVRFKSDAAGIDPMDWTNIYLVLARADTLPSSIRVPKKISLA
jgi:transcriptional regulator with XRE-family HTH domain